MKFLYAFLLMLPIYAGATNYYVASGGNDAANGLTPGTAWKTLSRANQFVYATSDSLLLNRGDIFFGSLIVNRSFMNYGAYGTGKKPIITGSIVISSWTSSGNGKYNATVAAKYSLNLVTIDSMPQYSARYPNYNSTNGGFLTYRKVTDTTTVIIPGASLLRNTIRGKVLNIRSVDYRMDRDSIVSVSNAGDTITYVRGSMFLSASAERLLPVSDQYGAFYSKDTSFLDTLGEWVHNPSTSQLKMFFGAANPASFKVEVAIVDTLINVGNKTNISIQDIDFYNAGIFAISTSGGNNTVIRRCSIINSGAIGIQTFQTDRITIDSVDVRQCLANGINNENNFAGRHYGIISNCNVSDIGLLHGMGSFNSGAQYRGILNGCRDTVTVEYCTVNNTGRSGIYWQGSTARIRYNVVSNTQRWFDDDGGIYTYASGNLASPGIVYSDRIMENNIAFNCGVYPNTLFGKRGNTILASSFYLDGRTMATLLRNNIGFGYKRSGLHTNNSTDVTVYNNIFYADTIPSTSILDAQRGISFFKLAGDTIRNLVIKKNVIYIFQPAFQSLAYHAITNTFKVPLPLVVPSYLTMDSNYMNYPNAQVLRIEASSNGVAIPNTKYMLSEWQSNFMQDLNTTKLPSLPKYLTRLVYNPGRVPLPVTLDANYVSATGQFYPAGTFLLDPFSGVLLLYDSPTIPIPSPNKPVRLKIRRG